MVNAFLRFEFSIFTPAQRLFKQRFLDPDIKASISYLHLGLCNMNNVVATKDSKTQIMQAFGQIIADRNKLESKIATKQEEADKEKNQQIIAVASTYTVDGIVKGLADLQLEFGGIVNALSEKVAAENSKLDELKQAFLFETQHLQELQRIRIVADVLDILAQEHQEKLKAVEQSIAEGREAIEKDITQKRKDWQKEQTEFDTAIQEFNELSIKERDREVEEFQYKLADTRKIAADEYEELKRTTERQLQESTLEKQKQWIERETFMAQSQPLFIEYQQKVATFTQALEEEVKKAREEAIKDITQKAKVDADLFEKEWQANKQNYELRIQSTAAAIDKQAEQIESITTQLQSTLKQSQDLAMRAFATSAK